MACTQMFIGALFIITNTEKYPNLSQVNKLKNCICVHVHHGIILRNQKGWTVNICNNVDRSQNNCAEERSQPKKKHRFCGSIYTEF